MIGAILSAAQGGLTAGGWIVMVACVGLVCGLAAFCFYHILSESKPSKHHHAPLDIDTRDLDEG